MRFIFQKRCTWLDNPSAKLDDFEDWELDGMLRDCWIYYPALDCGGDIDRQAADAFKTKLVAELKKRGRDDLLFRLKDEAERREVE